MQPTKKENKRNHNQRIMQVELGTFSPLVFSIYSGMGREYQAFYSRLNELLLCLRGSRSRNRNITEVKQDIAAQYELRSIR